MTDILTAAIDAFKDTLDRRPQYGDGLADVSFIEDTTISAPVYARKIYIAPGIVVASVGPMILFARETITNRGILRPQRPGSVALGRNGYAGYNSVGSDDNHDGLFSFEQAGLFGSGGWASIEAGIIAGGGGYEAFDPADYAFHTPFQFFNWLANLPGGIGGARGAAGGAGAGALAGSGGLGGGFLAAVTPTFDNTDGVIDLQGQDGSPAANAADAPAWQASHAYVVGDLVQPTTPNGHAYRAEHAGTSDPTEPASWPTDLTLRADGEDELVWQDITNTLNAAGGGGAGQGGIFAFFGRDYIGSDPDLDGGDGGEGFGSIGEGSATTGVAGAPGIKVVLLDR